MSERKEILIEKDIVFCLYDKLLMNYYFNNTTNELDKSFVDIRKESVKYIKFMQRIANDVVDK